MISIVWTENIIVKKNEDDDDDDTCDDNHDDNYEDDKDDDEEYDDDDDDDDHLMMMMIWWKRWRWRRYLSGLKRAARLPEAKPRLAKLLPNLGKEGFQIMKTIIAYCQDIWWIVA